MAIKAKGKHTRLASKSSFDYLSGRRISDLSLEEAYKVREAMAKSANQRLKAIEDYTRFYNKQGLTMSNRSIPAYRLAQRVTRTDKEGIARFSRKKFTGTPQQQLNALRREISELREFIDAGSSLVQNIRGTVEKLYLLALEKGFEGDIAELMFLKEKAWTEANKKYFASEQINHAVMTGQIHILDDIMSALAAQGRLSEVNATNEYARRYGVV